MPEISGSTCPAPRLMDGSGVIPALRVGGIMTASITRQGLAEHMVRDVNQARSGASGYPKVVVATNGLVIALYHRHPEFRKLIDQADIVDADGMPLVFASRWRHKEPLPERVATTDFLWDAAEHAARNGIRFFLLGAMPGVANRTAELLLERFPDLQIAGIRHGYFDAAETPEICRQIRDSGTDILWVGRGSPVQEQFAIEQRANLAGLAWIRTCGGLFDHVGGGMRRAPAYMQKAGLEWLHRAMLEPRRLGVRYLMTNPVAVYHLLTKTR